jgi:hypothetical protein
MTYLYRVEKNDRSAQIELVDEVLEVHYYESTSYVGTIEYPDKSYEYALSAACNWVDLIMTRDTLDEYKRT